MKYYLPVLTALIIYTGFSIFAGRTSINSVMELEKLKSNLEENLYELNRINEQLNDDLNSLSSDPQRIAIQSRQLNYIQEGEKILFMNNDSAQQFDVGTIMNIDYSPETPENLYKSISFFIFLLGISISFLIDRKKNGISNL